MRQIPNFMQYEAYASNAEALFYQRPDYGFKQRGFSIPAVNPEKWECKTDRHWSYVLCKSSSFPNQGWKIHVTASQIDAQYILYDVANFLIDKEVSFKYVTTPEQLFEKNAKYADRSASGKFITIYPTSEEEFIYLLDKLKSITDRYSSGPYILNDMQWKESNVFFRYGGMVSIQKLIDGVPKYVIQKPNGDYVEDLRVPIYHVPGFIHEPDYVKKNNILPNVDDSIFKQYTVLRALHFSNAGGVYLAEKDGQRVVLKEGRRDAGVDGLGFDGAKRVQHEYETLSALTSVYGVVNPISFFEIWKHSFLVEEYVDGITLGDYIARYYPYYDTQNDITDKYAENSIRILDDLRKVLISAHQSGWALCDISPNNIIIDNSYGKTTIIDLEAAQPVSGYFRPAFMTHGFGSSNASTFEEQDWYAWWNIAKFLFMPISPIGDLCANLDVVHFATIRAKFGEKALAYLSKSIDFVSRYIPFQMSGKHAKSGTILPKTRLENSSVNYFTKGLTKGLLRDIRLDCKQLIHGDVSQDFSSLGYENIAWGGFGALLALHRTGSWKELDGLQEWISRSLAAAKNESQQYFADWGLFTGIAGIVSAIYEMGMTSAALQILSCISKETIDSLGDDVSMWSGLSGIGLLLLTMKDVEQTKEYNGLLTYINERIFQIYSKENQNRVYGLLTGWAGAYLYIWKYGKYCADSSKVDFAMTELSNLLAQMDNESEGMKIGVVSTDGTGKALQYLEDGIAGIALVLMELYKDDPEKIQPLVDSYLTRLIQSIDVPFSADAGLLNGYAGFLATANAYADITGLTDFQTDVLHGLNNYLIRQGDTILVPGKYGYKCSMDYATGSAGVLLVLSDVKHHDDWSSWLPVPKSRLRLFCKE